ncbi:MAG TPA: PLP-dependent aminotransferase family protein [Isosphaeraceae bacterium]|jgi:2-aminoadipate transaminase|nr:PLP-dependent aminotransferase family protein [Isosphaeraceae bacterium]
MTPTIPLSAAARRTGEPSISVLMQRALAEPRLISLAAGFVDQASLPVAAASTTIADLLADPIEARRALQYGTTRGDLLFRSRLVDRLEREEHAEPGAFAAILPRVVVTTGSQQLLYLVAEALLDPGDIVIVEEPTYFVFLGLLATRGAVAVGVPTDAGGLRLDALEATLRDLEASGRLDRVKLIYTISEHGNPSGLSLAPGRRGALVALAEEYSKQQQIFILEDAAYRGLTFSGDEPASVWGRDEAGRTVILARTFSKTFSPGVKTGFGVLPEGLVGPVLALKTNHDFGSSHFHQQFLDRAMADGAYDRQIARLVAVYRRKRDVVLGALDEHLGPLEREGSVSWTRPNGGIYVWLTLPEGLDAGPDGPLFDRCVERGVLYVPGAYAFPAEGAARGRSNHIRLCYGAPGEAELAEGVARLAAALADCLDPVA